MKGICPVCGGVYQLRKDGKLRQHATSVKWGWATCPGRVPEKIVEVDR